MIVRVVALHIAAVRREPMRAVDRVHAEAGKGLVGDRYHGTRHRHVSVQSQQELDEASAELGWPVLPALTRRNITFDHGVVPVTPGDHIVVGGAVLEVVRRAAPCRVMDEVVGAGARRAMHGRGGSVCRVVTGGTIAIGAVAHFDLVHLPAS